MTTDSIPGFKCNRCGNCCTNLDAYYTTVSEADIRIWEEQGRNDILEWVQPLMARNIVLSYDIWVDPETGEDADGCPWLEFDEHGLAECRIHDLKPEVCREYPYDREIAIGQGCQGFR